MAFTQRINVADVVEGERFRKDYGDLRELAASLEKNSQIEPIVLGPGNLLVAGGRRLRAVMLLADEGRAVKGFAVGELEAVYNGHVKDNPRLLRELELEENIRRKDMDMSERAALTLEIDRLMRAEHGDAVRGQADAGWGLKDTATLLDKPLATVHRDIALGLAFEEYPFLKDMSNRSEVTRWLDQRLAGCLRERDRRRIAARGLDAATATFAHARAQDYLATLAAESIDLVLVDPPYGVDFESRVATADSRWDDSETGTLAFLEEAVPLLTRVVKRNAHLYMFTSEFLLGEVKGLLYRNGWDVDVVSLIWVKNTTGQVDFNTRYAPKTEFVVFARRPHLRRLNAFGHNVLTFPSVPAAERTHPTEKPQALLKYLISQSTIEGESVLDFCAGSGSTLVSALELDRLVYGCEENAESHATAANWIAKAAYLHNLEKARLAELVLEEPTENAEDDDEVQGEAEADL